MAICAISSNMCQKILFIRKRSQKSIWKVKVYHQYVDTNAAPDKFLDKLAGNNQGWWMARFYLVFLILAGSDCSGLAVITKICVSLLRPSMSMDLVLVVAPCGWYVLKDLEGQTDKDTFLSFMFVAAIERSPLFKLINNECSLWSQACTLLHTVHGQIRLHVDYVKSPVISDVTVSWSHAKRRNLKKKKIAKLKRISLHPLIFKWSNCQQNHIQKQCLKHPEFVS